VTEVKRFPPSGLVRAGRSWHEDGRDSAVRGPEVLDGELFFPVRHLELQVMLTSCLRTPALPRDCARAPTPFPRTQCPPAPADTAGGLPGCRKNGDFSMFLFSIYVFQRMVSLDRALRESLAEVRRVGDCQARSDGSACSTLCSHSCCWCSLWRHSGCELTNFHELLPVPTCAVPCGDGALQTTC